MTRSVRDRDVVLLAAVCVAIVLGLQVLAELFPAFGDAIGRPPTMIVALVVVTGVILARAGWASFRNAGGGRAGNGRAGDGGARGGRAGEDP